MTDTKPTEDAVATGVFTADEMFSLISHHPPFFYDMTLGMSNIDDAYSCMLSMFATAAEVMDPSDPTEVVFNADIYQAFLEQMLYMAISDLNTLSRIVTVDIHESTLRELQLEEMAHDGLGAVLRKFMYRYLYGAETCNLLKTIKLHSEYEYEKALKSFDHLPEHMRPAAIKFLEDQTPNVYPHGES